MPQPPARPARTQAQLINDLRDAERYWQNFAKFDNWPGGNPWAEHRDAAAAKHAAVKAQLAEIMA